MVVRFIQTEQEKKKNIKILHTKTNMAAIGWE